MSEEQLKAFLEKVKDDTSLQEKLKAAADAEEKSKIEKIKEHYERQLQENKAARLRAEEKFIFLSVTFLQRKKIKHQDFGLLVNPILFLFHLQMKN